MISAHDHIYMTYTCRKYSLHIGHIVDSLEYHSTTQAVYILLLRYS
jgi:hypothetical protein